MAIKSLINGQSSDMLSSNDRGLQYGDGLFETIAVENKTLLCWDEHIERLQKGCARLKLQTVDTTQLKNEAYSLITSTEPHVIKVIITRGQSGRGYALPDNAAATRIISLHPWADHPKENAMNGVKVRVCEHRYSQNSTLAGIKHLNRLEQIMARSEWNDNAIAEGIVLDTDNNVIEGTMSNIFYVRNKTLYTPELSQCGVEGVIRQKVIELANELAIDISIETVSLEALLNAEEIFISNSVIGVWPVKMVDNKTFSIGGITDQIRNALQQRNLIASSC